MFGFGLPEMIVILVIVVLVFGVGKLPEVGGALGKSIRNFKKASEGKDAVEVNPDPDKAEAKGSKEESGPKEGEGNKQG